MSEAKRQWSLGLIEARLTNVDAIKSGLAKARRSKNPFLPSVGQFIEWCHEAMRERIAFPSLDSVIVQMVRYQNLRKYSSPVDFEIHPVAYWVYTHVDTFAFSRADEKECRRIVGIAYDEAQEKAADGFEFPAPPALLGENIRTNEPRTEEQEQRAKQTLADLKKIVGLR